MGILGHIMKFLMIIVVVILVGLILFCGALFLFPNLKLFGYHYVNSGMNNGSYEYLSGTKAKAQQEWNEADIIRFETSGYDLVFEYASSDLLLDSGDVVSKIEGVYRGFVKGSVSQPTYSSSNSTFDKDSEDPYNSYYKDNTRPDKKIYFVRMQEPEKGILIKTTSVITILLTNDAFKNKDVEIFAKGGKVTFASNGEMSANSLTINSESGGVYLGDVKLNTYEEAGIEKAGHLSITKSKKGKIELNNDIVANIDIVVNGGTDTIRMKNVFSTLESASKVNIKNHNGAVYIGNIYGDLSCNTHGAKMVVGDVVGTTRLVVKETACSFKTIGANPQVDTLAIEAKGKTNITFEKVYSKIDIGANTGSTITVKESYGDVLYGAANGKGTLNLNCVHQSTITIASTSGKVNIYAEPNEKVDIISTATAGSIFFTGIRQGKVEINKANEYSSCSVVGSFVEVHGDSVIKTTSGKIDIKAPHSDNYSLEWTAKSASLDIFGTAKTTTRSSAQYCKDCGEAGLWCTSSYGQPCAQKYDSINLVSTTGRVLVGLAD